MASSFPTALDDFTNPTSSDTMQAVPHATQHENANDAIEALEAKVGIDDSADPDSLDHRVRALEAGKVNLSTKTGAYTLTDSDGVILAGVAEGDSP